MKNTLKTEHPARREAPRLHRKRLLIEEMVSLEKNQTCSLVRISAGKKASQRLWMFKEPSYVGALNDTSTQHKSEDFQLAGQEENLECRLKEIMYGLIQAPRLWYLKFDNFMQKDKARALTWQSSTSLSEPCRDVHQVGDEREVDVLRSFNWPLSELIMEDSVLPERGYSKFNDISSGYLVAQPQVNPGSMIAQVEQITPFKSRVGQPCLYSLFVRAVCAGAIYRTEVQRIENEAKTTAKHLTAKRNQERVKSILLLAIPDEYLLKFHNVPDAKSLWAAIKSSLDKAYDRFQKLISQLEVHAAPVSKEDINQKFLRNLPPLWIQIALIVRNKPDIDQTDIDDLYNNLRVYEDEMKRSSNSTSNSQNLAFLSSKNTSSTNEVSAASGNFGVNTAGGTSSTNQVSSAPGADEVKTERNLDFKGKQLVTFDKSKVECYNCHRKGHFDKECKSGRNQGKRPYGDNGKRNATINEPSSQALVAQDGLGGYD
ncbi:ribonuclease H-like domain-containing protein [Tanacetum coccineum]